MSDTTPPIRWEPFRAQLKNSHLERYMQWLSDLTGLHLADYQALWQWSITNVADFWESQWAFFEVIQHQPYTSVLEGTEMPHYRWFEGATLNYAEHIFRKANPEHPAILFQSERQALTAIAAFVSPATIPATFANFSRANGRSVLLSVSNSTSDMFTIKPRAVSRVCRIALNC
jgi:acetoacetyl-CoA synthetase